MLFRTVLTPLGLAIVLHGCGATQPPCHDSTCKDLCPAGTTADWQSELARTCNVGADVDVTVETEGGKGSIKVRCEDKGGTKFLCRPVKGETICGNRGIDYVTRDRLQCAKSTAQ